MSLARTSPRGDDLVRRYLEHLRAELEPDPLFRRRLRGVVTNRFVAAREGLAEPAAGPARMGRLGRACLYASFALAMSVGGALGASRGAVPGDLLYPLKLQMEAIRLRTFPEAFHDDLLIYTLGERMAEFGRLVEEGQMERAASLAQTIGAGYHELATLGIEVDAADVRANLAVLEALSQRLPPEARDAIANALQTAPGLVQPGAVSGSSPIVFGANGASTRGSAAGPPAMPLDPPGAAAPGASSGSPSPRASRLPGHGIPPNVQDRNPPSD